MAIFTVLPMQHIYPKQRFLLGPILKIPNPPILHLRLSIITNNRRLIPLHTLNLPDLPIIIHIKIHINFRFEFIPRRDTPLRSPHRTAPHIRPTHLLIHLKNKDLIRLVQA